ncbi:hypothetical protein [Aequorivita capsosiphonis]|uniref:hypothetical protein n=1 Tax=Aequorivita capsosiphonis TaxID=487317 RepID=UPI0004795F70|nr:hypothetical protein [Aequorivita capsosiphonis]
MLIDIFKSINQRKLAVYYVLMERLFISIGLIKRILKVNKKVLAIGRYKYHRKSGEGKQLLGPYTSQRIFEVFKQSPNPVIIVK